MAENGTSGKSSEKQFHRSDWGNAQRVVDRHGKDLRYVHPWKKWLTWDGNRWAVDNVGKVEQLAKETIKDLWDRATDGLEKLGPADDGDEDREKKRKSFQADLKHASGWHKLAAIKACVELAKTELVIPARPEQLDTDPWLLNVPNGTIDLRTGELRLPRREDMLTKLAPVEYDRAAACPTWDRFLDHIMGGNTGLVAYLQRVVGYCLTGDVREQAIWFFHGGGANGKSTFLGTVLAMLGDYGTQAASDLLMAKHHESHPTGLAGLAGRRFVATIETEEGKRMAEALVKQLTGGDRISARRMREDFWEFCPTFKIMLAANHKPQVHGTDNAMWRRIKLVPFKVTITEEEKDKQLPEKLKAELPGILAWAVKGCLDWQRDGLAEPAEVREATSDYQAEQDTVRQFIEEHCNKHPELKVKSSVLFDAYRNRSGDRLMTPAAFKKQMEHLGYKQGRVGAGKLWRGLTLAPDQDYDLDDPNEAAQDTCESAF